MAATRGRALGQDTFRPRLRNGMAENQAGATRAQKTGRAERERDEPHRQDTSGDQQRCADAWRKPMAEPNYAKAYEAIGEFFCAYSALEGELAEAVKAIFCLHEHPAADTIVAALEDFARKARLVRGAVS